MFDRKFESIYPKLKEKGLDRACIDLSDDLTPTQREEVVAKFTRSRLTRFGDNTELWVKSVIEVKCEGVDRDAILSLYSRVTEHFPNSRSTLMALQDYAKKEKGIDNLARELKRRRSHIDSLLNSDIPKADPDSDAAFARHEVVIRRDSGRPPTTHRPSLGPIENNPVIAEARKRALLKERRRGSGAPKGSSQGPGQPETIAKREGGSLGTPAVPREAVSLRKRPVSEDIPDSVKGLVARRAASIAPPAQPATRRTSPRPAPRTSSRPTSKSAVKSSAQKTPAPDSGIRNKDTGEMCQEEAHLRKLKSMGLLDERREKILIEKYGG